MSVQRGMTCTTSQSLVLTWLVGPKPGSGFSGPGWPRSSQIILTMSTYSHVMPALQREAADRLEVILAGI